MTNGSNEATMDLWDQLDSSTWYQPMPPRTMDEEVSGETESLRISNEMGAFWLKDPYAQGEDDYKTLAEAKEAGQTLLDRLWDEKSARFAKEAGLDPEVWTCKYNGEGLHNFGNGDGLDSIVRTSATEWHAFHDSEVEVGTFSTAVEAAAALMPTPKP